MAVIGNGCHTVAAERLGSYLKCMSNIQSVVAVIGNGSGLPLPRVTCAPGFVDTNLTLEHKTTKVGSVRKKNPTEDYPGQKKWPYKSLRVL